MEEGRLDHWNRGGLRRGKGEGDGGRKEGRFSAGPRSTLTCQEGEDANTMGVGSVGRV